MPENSDSRQRKSQVVTFPVMRSETVACQRIGFRLVESPFVLFEPAVSLDCYKNSSCLCRLAMR